MGTQEIGSIECISGNPAKSASIGGGVRVNTLMLACDHPKPRMLPRTRISRYCTSGSCALGAAQTPLHTTNGGQVVPAGGEVVGSAVGGVGEAIGQAASALPEQRIGDGSVIVVNNS